MASAFRLALLTLLLLPAAASAEPSSRPSLVKLLAADLIVIREGYSSRKITISDPDVRKGLLSEISKLDRGIWKEVSIIKHGGCSLHVHFSRGSEGLMTLLVNRNKVYQAPGGSTHNPQFVLEVAADELTAFRKASAQLPRGERCKNAA